MIKYNKLINNQRRCMFGKMGEMGKLVGQMKDMKSNMARIQEEIKNISETGGANGVRVTINGAHVVQEIKIEKSLSDDIEMLEDLLISACNEANQKVVNKSAMMMKEVTGGLDLPI